MDTAPPAAGGRLRAWTGLAAFYAASFAVLAAFMQFFPLWLHRARGLSEAHVAWVFAAMTAARTIAGPLWARRADRSGRPRRTLVWLSVLSLGAFLCFGAAETVAGLVLCGVLFGCCYPAIHSIQDALAMATAQRRGFAYGRIRVTGSISFLVAVVAVGRWLDGAEVGALYDLLVVGLLLTCAASLLLPAAGYAGGPPAAPAAIGPLLRSRSFQLLLAASALVQGSHAVYYNLSTIHWRQNGIPESTAGVLWAEGVLAEIVLFVFARGSVERLRPTTMIVLGGVLAAVRWTALGATTSVPLLLLANWLHAFSFGCTYLGALRALETRVPPWQRATAQSLVGAAAMGVGMVTASLLGGYVYERAPALAFFTMAGFALAGAGIGLVLRRGRSSTTSDQSSASATPP